MNFSGWILKKAGWTFKVNLTMPDKCIIVIAPHTSNWDFILGELGIHSVGMKAGFLMKDTWFFFPLGYLLRGLGGIPVNRRQHGNLTHSIVEASTTGTRASRAIKMAPLCQWGLGLRVPSGVTPMASLGVVLYASTIEWVRLPCWRRLTGMPPRPRSR